MNKYEYEYKGIYHIRKKKNELGKTTIIKSDYMEINLTEDENDIKIMIGTDDDLIKLPPIFDISVLIPVDKLDYVINKLNEIKKFKNEKKVA